MQIIKFINEEFYLPLNPESKEIESIIQNEMNGKKILTINDGLSYYEFTKFFHNGNGGVTVTSQVCEFFGIFEKTGQVKGEIQIPVRGIVSIQTQPFISKPIDLKEYIMAYCNQDRLEIFPLDTCLLNQIIIDTEGLIHGCDLSDFVEELRIIRNNYNAAIRTLCDGPLCIEE